MKTSARRRIAYYTMNDPLDKRTWSGITYYLGQSLQKNIGDIHFLQPVKIPWLLDKLLRGMQKFTRFFFKTAYIPKYSLLKNKYVTKQLQQEMKGRQYDILFAPAAASELACLRTKIPIVYFGDATYKAYSETYDKEFKSLNSFSKWEGDHLEKRALTKSAVVVLTSQWAALSAIHDYHISPDKIEVILMGANIDAVPEKNVIFKKEATPVLTLLFLGVDWERKGGAIAFDTLTSLHAAGVSAKLIVCGVVPPKAFAHPAMEVIPFLDKNEVKDYEQFVALLSSVHFLLVPTRADCSLLVNAEANAYGVPTISTNIGGVADVVKDGINGYCLPFTAKGEAYAATISSIFFDKERYHRLIVSSRQTFENVLNWDSFAVFLESALQRHGL